MCALEPIWTQWKNKNSLPLPETEISTQTVAGHSSELTVIYMILVFRVTKFNTVTGKQLNMRGNGQIP